MCVRVWGGENWYGWTVTTQFSSPSVHPEQRVLGGGFNVSAKNGRDPTTGRNGEVRLIPFKVQVKVDIFVNRENGHRFRIINFSQFRRSENSKIRISYGPLYIFKYRLLSLIEMGGKGFFYCIRFVRATTKTASALKRF